MNGVEELLELLQKGLLLYKQIILANNKNSLFALSSRA